MEEEYMDKQGRRSIWTSKGGGVYGQTREEEYMDKQGRRSS
jgi:hypothetical protein